MQYFWVVSIFHLSLAPEEWANMSSKAISHFEAQGIEEYALTEPEVDILLGERSYSGGDLPGEILDEVDERVWSAPHTVRFYFDDKRSGSSFFQWIKSEFLCEVQIERCPQEDWNAQWRKHYSPIKVNGQLEVVPAWYENHISTSQKQVYIHPGMGFGTGGHETTFLCLKLFTEQVLANSELGRVLDFGSGSGILGLAALIFRPVAKVDFYDIDPEANKNCWQNAEVNHLTNAQFRLLLPEVRHELESDYHLIFANILENILVEEKSFLVEKLAPKGYLILSGILNHQVQGIAELFSKAGLKLIQHLQKGDWSALLWEKAAP